MYIGKIEETVKLLEQTAASFTEMERQQIAWYAFKIGDDELTQKLVEELSEDDCNRESIMQKYDEIIVLNNGKVAEKGSFEKLMREKGYFYSLYMISRVEE